MPKRTIQHWHPNLINKAEKNNIFIQPLPDKLIHPKDLKKNYIH